LSSSPLLDLVRAGAFVMLLFAAILISVVIRNLEGPIRFGTRSGPILVGVSLVLFALPIYGDVTGTGFLVQQGSLFRVFAGLGLPTGLYLMHPFAIARTLEKEEQVEDEAES